ncbi:MAG TPA: MFS transporter [Solirubrobacterales bacterium]|nr:MFS transporter [Solirubrobacterales bacterium]
MSDDHTRKSSNLLIFVVCLAQFMVILDISIVNVALPRIHDSLDFSETGLQWVVNAYTLAFAGFLMLGGRANDLIGRRKVFLVGVGLFSVASLGCAVADSQAALIVARTIQGLGAAVISPASLAILTASFAEGSERNRALGIWGAMAGLGGSAGALLGGILTQSFGWEAVFLINVPIGAAVVAAGRAVIPRHQVLAEERHFDLAGAVLISGGLTAFVFGIVRTDTLSWGSPGVLGPLLAGLAMLAAFFVVEGRVARDPLIPLHVFRMPLLRAANLIIALLFAGIFAMWFFVSLYLQQVHHDDALEAGIAFLPMTLSIAGASTMAPRLVARFGVRPVLSVGMLMASLGLLLLSGMSADGTYASNVLPGGVLATLGAGSSMVPATILAVRGVPQQESGLASGVLNTSRLAGGTIGLAVLSTIATSQTNSKLAAGVASGAAFTDGYQVAFELGAALCLLGAIAAVTLLRGGAVGAEAEPEPA